MSTSVPQVALLLLTAVWSTQSADLVPYPLRVDEGHFIAAGFTPAAHTQQQRGRALKSGGSGGGGEGSSGGSGENSSGGVWGEEPTGANRHFQWLVVADGSNDVLYELGRDSGGGAGGDRLSAGAILVPPSGLVMWMTAARAKELSERQGVISGEPRPPPLPSSPSPPSPPPPSPTPPPHYTITTATTTIASF